jgi:ribonuclease T1
MRCPPTSIAHHRARVLVVLAALIVLVLAACSSGADDTATAAPAAPGSALTTELGFAAQPPSDWDGGIIEFDDLPPEAHGTLVLISTDGPYPYDQDGSTFQNREGILPQRQLGFYLEFTVETPGSPDRGARRLVVGGDQAAFYTADHYDSFRFITP